MSTQVLEHQTANVKELTAETVKAVVSSSSQVNVTRNYAFTVEIFKKFERAFIRWSLDTNYAIGSEDVVQLREGDRFLSNLRVDALQGEWDTGCGYGSGLNASYWAWNYVTDHSGWCQLACTPNT